MVTIALISCASKKRPSRSKAKELYISPLFRYALRYAASLHPNKTFILSAKYGLLDLERVVEPYNLTLNSMQPAQNKEWALRVLHQLETEAHVDIHKDTFIFLAGERYRKYLIPELTHYDIPLKGLGIGKQLQFLKQRTHNE